MTLFVLVGNFDHSMIEISNSRDRRSGYLRIQLGLTSGGSIFDYLYRLAIGQLPEVGYLRKFPWNYWLQLLVWKPY